MHLLDDLLVECSHQVAVAGLKGYAGVDKADLDMVLKHKPMRHGSHSLG